MSSFLDILATGARSLSFEKRCTVLDFEHENYESNLPFKIPQAPRTPEEIMREAWEDVGNRLWEAMGVVKSENAEKFTE